MRRTYLHIIAGLLLASLLTTLVCYKIDDLPVILWDESRQAINAWEMYKNNNWLVTTFDGSPEFYNTKPPLLIWLQVICFKIFGASECALRLPSVLAALLTCWFIWRFSFKVLQSRVIGALACLILVTFTGYNNIHAVRTGDYDALLTCFTTGYLLYGYRYITEKRVQFLHTVALLLLLAVMTKGVAGILPLPALFILSFNYRKELHYKWLLTYVVLLTASVALYYVLREQATPGYFHAVINNELGGRYLKSAEGHAQDTWFYFRELFLHRTSLLLWLLPLSILVLRKNAGNRLQPVAMFTLLSAGLYLIIITMSKTKLYWYDVPAMPLLAMLLAMTIHYLTAFIIKKWQLQNITPAVHLTVLVLLLLWPCIDIFRNITNRRFDDYDPEQYRFSEYLRSAAKQKGVLKHYVWINDGQYLPQYKFYTHILAEQGDSVILGSFNQLKPGDHVLTHQKSVQDTLEKHFLCNTLSSGREYPVKRYVITGYQDTLQ